MPDHSSVLVSSCHGAVASPSLSKSCFCVRRSAMIGNTSRLTKAGWRASSRVSAVSGQRSISAVMTLCCTGTAVGSASRPTGQTAIPSGSPAWRSIRPSCPLPRTQTCFIASPADRDFPELHRFALCASRQCADAVPRRVAPESARRAGRR